MRTLFVNAFPTVVTLNTWVVEVWKEAQAVLGAVEQSGRSRGTVGVQNPLFGGKLIFFN